MANEKINKAPCFLKYIFIFLCFVLLLMAAGIFIQTLIYKSELEFYSIYLEHLYKKPVLFLLVGSVILEFVGLFGLISAVKNSQPGIIIFCMCLVYLLVSMFSLAVITYFLSSSAENLIYSQLENHINNYSLNQEVVDELQIKLHCCGIDDFTDWQNLTDEIPRSCCNSAEPCVSLDLEYSHGCFKSLIKFIKSYEKILMFVLIVLGQIEILAIVFSCLLGRAMSNNYQANLSDCQRDSVGTIQLPRINNPLGQVTITRPQKKETVITPEPVFLRGELPRSLISENRQLFNSQSPTRYQYLQRATLNTQKSIKTNAYIDHFG